MSHFEQFSAEYWLAQLHVAPHDGEKVLISPELYDEIQTHIDTTENNPILKINQTHIEAEPQVGVDEKVIRLPQASFEEIMGQEGMVVDSVNVYAMTRSGREIMNLFGFAQ